MPKWAKIVAWLIAAFILLCAVLWVAGAQAANYSAGERHLQAQMMRHGRLYPPALWARWPELKHSRAQVERQVANFNRAGRIKFPKAHAASLTWDDLDYTTKVFLVEGEPTGTTTTYGAWGLTTDFAASPTRCISVNRTKIAQARIGAIAWTQGAMRACARAGAMTYRSGFAPAWGVTTAGQWTLWHDRGTEAAGSYLSSYTTKRWLTFRFEQEVCAGPLGCLTLHTAKIRITLWIYANMDTQSRAEVWWS